MENNRTSMVESMINLGDLVKYNGAFTTIVGIYEGDIGIVMDRPLLDTHGAFVYFEKIGIVWINTKALELIRRTNEN